MPRIEKSVFISYRRTNVPWALNVYQDLTHHGYDVFFDFEGIGSGDFESIIVDNITSRAHFLILLTPSALERCGDPGDWLRREIEVALETKRNIVPLMLEGFSFGTATVASQLTGKLASLKSYNGLSLPPEYFFAAMEKLRTTFLNVVVSTALHTPSTVAREAAHEQKVLADAAPPVQEEELKAQQYFERAFASTDLDEKVYFNTEAIRLKPDFAKAYYNRAHARQAKGDIDGALADYGETIRLNPDLAEPYTNRGILRHAKGDLDAALLDYNEAIRLNPNLVEAHDNRGNLHKDRGNVEAAILDHNEAILLQPEDPKLYHNRGICQILKGNLQAAFLDYSEAIRLRPDYAKAFYTRGFLLRKMHQPSLAIADFEQYLSLRGGERDSDTESVERYIRGLKEQKQNWH